MNLRPPSIEGNPGALNGELVATRAAVVQLLVDSTVKAPDFPNGV